jgi:putative RNA 2'-phosphotransferase
MKQDLDKLSRFISLVLRHKPGAAGLDLDEHGWADVDELIDGINKAQAFTKEMLEEIVATDDKQRYSFNEDKTLIRANQGHSIPVDVELEEVEPPHVLYHGTASKYEASIDSMGLISKSRLYVHLSLDRKTATNVGKRHGELVMYAVDALKMYEDGYKFYKSANGVWLAKEVPVKYLFKLEV